MDFIYIVLFKSMQPLDAHLPIRVSIQTHSFRSRDCKQKYILVLTHLVLYKLTVVFSSQFFDRQEASVDIRKLSDVTLPCS